MAKWVYRFSEGNASMRPLLGGKGANLAEMTGLGMPIPQGFTVTTEACTEYYRHGKQITDEIIGAGLLTGLVCLASSYYQSKVCANGIAAIGNGHDVMGKTLILAAFPELYAILTVAAVFLIAGAI